MASSGCPSITSAAELGYPPELAKIDAGFREIMQKPEFQKLVKITDKNTNE